MAIKTTVNAPEAFLPVKPLTLQEMHDATHSRVSLIDREFTDGFNFIARYPRSVTFFGSARVQDSESLYESAQSLGKRIAEELHYAVFTGGGPGIMEAASHGAYDAGGTSVGITIELPNEQVVNPYLTRHIGLYYFFSRKVCMSFAAEAYIFFPGGFGTLDEFFEILTLVQTRKIERVPIILFCSEYWKHFDSIFKEVLISRGFIDPTDTDLYIITDDHDLVIEKIKNAPIRNGIKFEHSVSKPLLAQDGLVVESSPRLLTQNELKTYLQEAGSWDIRNNKYLEKIFEFPTYAKAAEFAGTVAKVAEAENHHPYISIHDDNRVKISTTTRSVEGLTEVDFILAAKIDAAR